jgi:hypothetical protein
MPSRKKAQGKARKATKAKKEAEEGAEGREDEMLSTIQVQERMAQLSSAIFLRYFKKSPL